MAVGDLVEQVYKIPKRSEGVEIGYCPQDIVFPQLKKRFLLEECHEKNKYGGIKKQEQGCICK
jgi:hypothetical protein